jgi:5'-3' exonuclease
LDDIENNLTCDSKSLQTIQWISRHQHKGLYSDLTGELNLEICKYVIETQRKQYSFGIDPLDVQYFSCILSDLGIPVITAPYDSEIYCAYLLKLGLLDTIITNDSDALMFGASEILTKCDGVVAIRLNLESILSCLEISMDDFVKFCIFCGTDFTESYERVGPVTALKLLKTSETPGVKNSDIENIKSMENEFHPVVIPWCKLLSQEEINDILERSGYYPIDFSIEQKIII